MQGFPSPLAKWMCLCVLSGLRAQEAGFSCQSANVRPKRIAAALALASCVNPGSEQFPPCQGKNENSTGQKLALALLNKWKAIRHPDCTKNSGIGTEIQLFLFLCSLTAVLIAEYTWNIQIYFLFYIIQASQSNIDFSILLTPTSPEFAGKVQLKMDEILL